jgi:hypothetical protein
MNLQKDLSIGLWILSETIGIYHYGEFPILSKFNCRKKKKYQKESERSSKINKINFFLICMNQ